MSKTRRWALLTGVAVATTALLAGCAGSGSINSSGSSSKDEINYALPANFAPNWILPIGTAAHPNTNNIAIAASLWEPLVAYNGSKGDVSWDKDGSIATGAKFASDNKNVEITLGDRTWSDGKTVTSGDGQFWYNLTKANKEKSGSYSTGKAPDNWTSSEVDDDTHFTITFDKAYNLDWMLANELSLITPLPQHA